MVRTRRVYSGATLMRVLYPVALCMIFVAINVKLGEKRDAGSAKVIYGLFRSYDTHDNGLIALILMGFLILTTSLGVFCYKMKFYKAITVYIVSNSVVLLLVYSLFHLRNLAQSNSVPISLPLALFLTLNFGCLGVLGLHWKSPVKVHQFYLIMLASFTALFLVNNLPDWTVWIAILAISVWDIVAVLTPCGPLKMLVETASRRGDENFPAILYNASSYPSTPETQRSDNTEMTEFPSSANSMAVASDSLVASPTTPRRQREIREIPGTIRLGMGDFVFYSLMMGHTVQTSSNLTAIACFIANLVGLTITLPVVTLSQSALPALPFPLAIAALFYFSAHFALNPFTDLCATSLHLY